jgi:opacity protein-like surface antigen
MKILAAVLLLAMSSFAQTPTTTTASKRPDRSLNAGVGYLATTGSPGLSGVNVFAGYQFRGFELAGEFDASSSNIKVPAVNLKVHEQDYLFGPRYYFRKVITDPKFVPFAHLLFGLTHQSTKVINVGLPNTSSSDNSYAWDLGGGIEYHFTPKWAGRARADIFRTHFLDDSQTHARYGVGFAYTFGKRLP